MTEHRALVGLLTLPKLGPRRLTRLLEDHDGDPEAAWAAVRVRRVDHLDFRIAPDKRNDVFDRWQQTAVATDLDDLMSNHRRLGIDILDPDHADWPEALVIDPEPPPLLFCRGDRSLFATVAVAVVGTRRCTALGRSVARDLGRGLAEAGVVVVSGLALGIDGEAHRGALAGGGRPLGVVATGLDVVYPSRHRSLWDEVGGHGLLVSEAPAGTAAERWRFPARNRIMAALAELVVVVESPVRGGSMRTVESADERQTAVLAVPGPVRSPASAGTNQLLFDGCGVARDTDDVLAALGALAPAPPGRLFGDDVSAELATDPVLDAVSWPAVSVERLAAVTGLGFVELTRRLTELELAGAVERTPDGYQRVAP